MNAAVVHKLGEPPRCEPFPEPIAGDGEVVVHVRAAALKPVDRQVAAGSHYATPRQLPFICGIDGVGHLGDGQRVFFGGCRSPYGAMAELTVVPEAFAFPLPEALADEAAAVLMNPGVSAWLSLAARAKLAAGENVLVLGATGVTGRLAVKIAKLMGAGRVTAAGRNQQALDTLRQMGADATIRLNAPENELREAFLREAGASGFQVVIDYLWGHPTEILLSTMTGSTFAAIGTETRLVQVGESAGATISLPAAVLRSHALTILGTAGIPSCDILADALRKVVHYGASGELAVDTVTVPLREIEAAWQQDHSGRRVVVIP